MNVHWLSEPHTAQDIFFDNCFKNGILPIKISREDLDKLSDDAERGADVTLSIDLAKQEIRGPDGGMGRFKIDQHRKHCLLNGESRLSVGVAFA